MVRRSAAPQLCLLGGLHPTADARGPFTPALGLRVAPKATPHFEGTGGLYLCEGGESDRIFLLTVRHVVLPPSICHSDIYACKDNSKPRHEVIFFGTNAYRDVVGSIMNKIGRQAFEVSCYYQNELEALTVIVEG